jgi:hypothetical protein
MLLFLLSKHYHQVRDLWKRTLISNNLKKNFNDKDNQSIHKKGLEMQIVGKGIVDNAIFDNNTDQNENHLEINGLNDTSLKSNGFNGKKRHLPPVRFSSG